MQAARAVKAKLTFANVMASLAVFLVLTTGTAYAAATITSADIVNGTIQQVDIKPNSIGTNVLKDNGVKTADILDGTITGTDIAHTNSIVSDQVAALDGDADIIDNSITTFDIATDAVDSDEVLDFGLTNEDVGVLFAQVNADGTLANSSSANVTSTRISLGFYEVDFGRDISACAFLGSQGEAGVGGAPGGVVGATDRAGDANAAFVTMRTDAGVQVDRAFNFVVVC